MHSLSICIIISHKIDFEVEGWIYNIYSGMARVNLFIQSEQLSLVKMFDNFIDKVSSKEFIRFGWIFLNLGVDMMVTVLGKMKHRMFLLKKMVIMIYLGAELVM